MDDRNQGSSSYWTRTWRGKHDVLIRIRPPRPTHDNSGGILLDQSISDCGDRTAGLLGRVLRAFDTQEPLSLDDCG